jgi:glycosyltransferase involved in cell wall biosynthesis
MCEGLRDLGVTLHEFTLTAGASTLALTGPLPALPQTVIEFEPMAPRRTKALRPPLRYADDWSLGRRWAVLARAVNAWAPDVILANPCGVLRAAPPALERFEAPSVYYCDEARRHDYEAAARASTSRATRPVYALMRARTRRADRAAITSATALATNSSHSAAGIYSAYGREAAVITPGIADVFDNDGIDRAPLHVLSVGSLIPSKGHDLAIRALARAGLPLPLVVVAPRPEDAERSRLTAIAESAGVRVRFEFGISDGELVDRYRSALATLYLARNEPLGLVSLESQACGTPVIVAAEGGLAETVRNGETGFAVERDPACVALALHQIASESVRGEMVRRVRGVGIARNADAAAAVLQLLDDARSTTRSTAGTPSRRARER